MSRFDFGAMTHTQRPRGEMFVPPGTKNPLGVIQVYRDEKRVVNPRRQLKKRMKREGNLSSRQWRLFRKRMNQELKREMTGGGLRDGAI